MTPIWFGSAINSFGVQGADGRHRRNTAPSRSPSPAEPRQVAARGKKVAGFVFKVQANMDPKHRDRVAFVRLWPRVISSAA